MKHLVPGLLGAALLAGAMALVACEDGSDVTTEQAQDRINETSDDIKSQATDVWAGLRSDGERLIDEVQTRNNPDAKGQLLDRCRGAEEQLRQDGNASAGRVKEFCDQIQDTNPENSGAWNQIKARFNELSNSFQN